MITDNDSRIFPQRKRNKRKEIPWRMNHRDFKKLQHLVNEMENTTPNSDEHMAYIEDIRSLGWPKDADLQLDVVKVIITDKTPDQIARGR